MPVLHVKGVPAAQPSPEVKISNLTSHATLEDELDAIVDVMKSLASQPPDVMLSTCMALMARVTEIHLGLVRLEPSMRKAKALRTIQLQKVIDLIEFEFKAASRLVEVRRQEIELSK